MPPAKDRKAEQHFPQPVVIGWRECVAFPEWGITQIKAKADTGARTSAIDVADIEDLGHSRIRFHIVINRNRTHRMAVEARIVRHSRIKSSFGTSHDRYVVRTMVQLGPVRKRIELSLVSRKKMICRMLLGREALRGDFLVDPHRMYIFGRPKKARRASAAPKVKRKK